MPDWKSLEKSDFFSQVIEPEPEPVVGNGQMEENSEPSQDEDTDDVSSLSVINK